MARDVTNPLEHLSSHLPWISGPLYGCQVFHVTSAILCAHPLADCDAGLARLAPSVPGPPSLACCTPQQLSEMQPVNSGSFLLTAASAAIFSAQTHLAWMIFLLGTPVFWLDSDLSNYWVFHVRYYFHVQLPFLLFLR